MVKESVGKLLNAAPYLGAGTILKAIGKIAPRVGSFVSGAFTAGYAADEIVNFLKERMFSDEQKRDISNLSQRSAQRIARPDERAALSGYEQQMAPINAIGSAAKLGAQGLGGAFTVGQEMANEQTQLAQSQQQQQAQQERESFERERQLQLDTQRATQQRVSEQREGARERRAQEQHESKMRKDERKNQADMLRKKAASGDLAINKRQISPQELTNILDTLINLIP